MREFRQAVNMTPSAMRTWLDTEESRSVGMKPGGEKVVEPGQGEAVGHHMGRTILELYQPAVTLTLPRGGIPTQA